MVSVVEEILAPYASTAESCSIHYLLICTVHKVSD